MRALSHVTLSGVDRSVSPGELQSFLGSFPERHSDRIELGVLASSSRADTPRYPDHVVARAIVQVAHGYGAKAAVHLCGELARRVVAWAGALAEVGVVPLEEAIGGGWYDVVSIADRVQINLPEPDVTPAVAAEVAGALGKPTIFQLRKPAVIDINERGRLTNPERTFETFPPLPRGATWLFDQSAGSGTPPASWPRPVAGRLVGYAGGLTPHTIGQVGAFLTGAALGVGGQIWLDLESGLREPVPGAELSIFSLNRARIVVDALGPCFEMGT